MENINIYNSEEYLKEKDKEEQEVEQQKNVEVMSDQINSKLSEEILTKIYKGEITIDELNELVRYKKMSTAERRRIIDQNAYLTKAEVDHIEEINRKNEEPTPDIKARSF